MILRNPLATPHYRAPVVLARGSVSLATFIWSAIVVANPNALFASRANYAWITEYLPADVLGWTLGIITAIQLLWLLLSLTPVRFGAVGYALLTFWWGLVFVSVAFGAGPLLPTATSCVFVILALSIYAFVASPKEHGHGRLV